MKRKIYCSALLTLALPLGIAQAEEGGTSETNTLSSLETITREVDEAPTLLYLTPSQINTAEPAKNKSKLASELNALTKSNDEGASGRIHEMKALQATINQLKARISGQETILKQLRHAQSQQQASASELSHLQQVIKQTLQENVQLQQQLVTQVELQQQLAAKTKNNEQQAQQIVQLQQVQQASVKLQEQLTAQAKDNDQKTQDLKQLQQKLTETGKQQTAKMAAMLEPKTDQEKRDYAIGTSLGNDILDLLNSKKKQGVDVNSQLALVGISDVLNGQTKLAKEQIAKALYDSERELDEHFKQVKALNEKQGAKYIDKFKKQAGVVKSDQGFYYRIDYLGDEAISDADSVVVVVKESLTDGKVIKDMDLAGTSISQPLSAYPPLFREAIGKLKNHGSITLVVPPVLAYGDKGMEPNIPPGATMIYEVRIVDVIPLSSH